jgi:DNA ligase D-like protein (predicted polymerase)
MAARVLFPSTGFTTDDLCATYEQLAPVLLPHLLDRPVTLKRYPDDVQGEAFWEKDAPAFAPKRVRTFAVPRKHEPGVIRYISIPDVKTLRWAASVGCIEIHSFLHRYPYLTSPTVIAFDLDPGEGATIIDCCQVGVLVRQWFGRHDLRSFAKVSGSKGRRPARAVSALARIEADCTSISPAQPQQVLAPGARVICRRILRAGRTSHRDKPAGGAASSSSRSSRAGPAWCGTTSERSPPITPRVQLLTPCCR